MKFVSLAITFLVFCLCSVSSTPSHRGAPSIHRSKFKTYPNKHNSIKKPAKTPSTGNNARTRLADKQEIVAGWFANWAQYRTDPYDVEPEDLEPIIPSLDILYYGFAYFCPDSSMFQPYWVTELGYCDGKSAFDVIYIEPNDPTYFEQFVQYKESLNKNLSIVLSVGGWNFPSNYFSGMISNSEWRSTFIQSALQFIQEYQLDGIDIDWEYPGSKPRTDSVEISCDSFHEVDDYGGDSDDYYNFVLLMQEMREAFGDDYLITFCGQAGLQNVMNGFDLVSLGKYIDFINIMSYDYNVPQTNDTSISKYTGPNQPLYAPAQADGIIPQWNINQTLHGYLELGALPHQLLVGIAYYGHNWIVEDMTGNEWCQYGLESVYDPGNCCGPEEQTYGGVPGQYCIQCGEYGYYEILNAGFNETACFDPETRNYISYLYSEGADGYTPANTWITYQGPQTIKDIVNFGKRMGIRGAFGFDLTQDTYDTADSTWTYELTRLIEECVRDTC